MNPVNPVPSWVKAPPICSTDALEQSLDPNMTEWERSREREEFIRASILYRPSSSSLSSRFTRGKQEEDEDTVEVARDQEVETVRLGGNRPPNR